MAKIAIISDIHSNIHALNLLLKDIEKRNVDKIICLGDIVTKYFYPAEVVDTIKDVSDIVIKGNCDDLVTKSENYKFARSKLGLDRLEYLENLPIKEQIVINKGLVNLFHSNPHDLESMFNPLFDDNEHTRYKDMTIKTDDYKKMFTSDKPQTTIVGHTHSSYLAIEKDKKLNIVKSPQIITKLDRAIINVGSVGEHSHLEKDKNGEYSPIIHPYMTYLIVDDKDLESGFNAEIIKVPYKKELKKVFIDSIKGQLSGEFPYSPIFTQRMAESIKKQNENNEEISREIDLMVSENNEKNKKGRGL